MLIYNTYEKHEQVFTGVTVLSSKYRPRWENPITSTIQIKLLYIRITAYLHTPTFKAVLFSPLNAPEMMESILNS